MQVQQSIDKLSAILPIKKALDGLPEPTAHTYFSILNGFFNNGRAPLLHELTTIRPDAISWITDLADQDLITLDPQGEIKGCYPFTMEKRLHRIRLNGFEVNAMCALDALAPSAMFDCCTTVMSECAVTAKTIQLKLKNQSLLNSNDAANVHVGINWAAAGSGSCSDTLCTEMLFLIDEKTANNWLHEDAQYRNIFNIHQAIDFSARFFKRMLKQDKVNKSGFYLPDS